MSQIAEITMQGLMADFLKRAQAKQANCTQLLATSSTRVGPYAYDVFIMRGENSTGVSGLGKSFEAAFQNAYDKLTDDGNLALVLGIEQ